ncbi:MAG: permease [Desulfovibrio sp.]|uniref:AEC family transporter n=1 Tax=Desulfovibrio sp. TaxID=885 RepID=UPI001A76F9BA|nr:AEC family transporter [Desulfovibrio sp.]MBD5416449.1 permease [Desulfovibrio sp.]
MSHIILYAIVPIVVVMLAGYISGKKGIFNGEDAKKFNKVVLDYALPAALFVSIAQASRDMLYKDLKLSLVSLVVIMACFMGVYYIYKYCFKNNTGADAAVSALISGSPTIGFLGFAVLEPIFGATPAVALVVAIVGIVVNAVGIPVGLSLLNASLAKEKAANGKGGKKESGWLPVIHALEQPVAWAPILAVVWVLVGIPWPEWASPSFDLIAKANASMAVFSAGITLSAIKVVINWQAILGSILKLIVMPGLALLGGVLCAMDPLNIKMLVVACALPPAFSGIIIADEYDTYVATGTSSLTLSVILFIGFCPLWIWITDRVLSGAWF